MAEEAQLRPAVFLDRDGTVQVEVDYLADPAGVELIEGVGKSLAALQRAGFALVVVTNQSGVARGILDEARLAAIHLRLSELLALDGVELDGIYWCPHHPQHGEPPYRCECSCRKPLPGMLLDAAREQALDLARSWMIGDAERDLDAGTAASVRSILVETGKGADERARMEHEGRPPRHVCADLPAAVELILGEG